MGASSGIFFVVRLPRGWQLCSIRFSEYGLATFNDLWPELCGTLLGIWVHELSDTRPADAGARFAKIQQALSLFIKSPDAFPRGWVEKSEKAGKLEIHHGGDLTRAMRISRKEVEASFDLGGKVRWVERSVLRHNADKLEVFRRILAPDQDWSRVARGERPQG